MKIGLAYDLKEDVPLDRSQPDDALEEYDSPETVQGIAEALQKLGHTVMRLGGGREFLKNILEQPVDFVFNLAEGRGTSRSREAQIPAVLEMLGIPYSGSDPQCLAICLDKPLAKELVRLAGVRTPEWRVFDAVEQLHEAYGFPLPAFVKPAYEGSSKGIRSGSRVETLEQAAEVAARLLREYRQPVMVEEYIAGEELTVGIIGNRPPEVVGIMRVVPRNKDSNFVYSIEVKRDWERLVEYECPVRLDKHIIKESARLSLTAFQALGCRDFARVDFRVSPDGKPYFLEINPLAGLNPRSSDLPIMAGKMGWSYDRLIADILEAALERYESDGSHNI